MTYELGEVLIDERRIRQRVAELATEISRDHPSGSLTLLVALKGAMFFAADLARALERDAAVEFVRATSYVGLESSGRVSVEGRFDFPGQQVVIVDDIVDTGRTLDELMKRVNESGAKTVRLALLLSKPARRELPIEADYVGFEIPDEFVVGYGMDLEERYRNLRDIHLIRAESP